MSFVRRAGPVDPPMYVMVCVAVLLTHCLQASPAFGQDDAPAALAVRYSIKGSALIVRLPDEPVLFPARSSATGFGRLRIEPTWRVSDRTRLELAFDQGIRASSSTAAIGGLGVLPPTAAAPFRIRPLDWALASGSNAEWRGEIDRASLQIHGERLTLTAGRQAIGWGRGVLFSAIDLFAPFTPLEADREWRRGIDAVRADAKLSDRASFDAVAAIGDDVERSVFAARVRGYGEHADVELVGGRRAHDPFGGIASSAPIGRAEVHGEVALFRTVVKVVAGSSIRLGVGTGLLIYGEYHYSGFGTTSPAGMLTELQDPAFRERYLRGDTQILGRHATAVLASYEWSPELSASLQWIESPVDRSGVWVPALIWTLGDHWSAMANTYMPYGQGPSGPNLGSEFGASPFGVFLQIRFYH